MSNFSKLHGYDVKDTKARNDIQLLESNVDDMNDKVIENTLILNDIIDLYDFKTSGNFYFASGDGYSTNVLKFDLDEWKDELYQYKFINLISSDSTDKKNPVLIKFPFDSNGKKTLSSKYQCYARTKSAFSSTDGNITTTVEDTINYYGSITFISWVENNVLNVQTFNEPFGIQNERVVKRNNTTSEIISDESTKTNIYDSNGSMIVSGGEAGFYTGIKNVILTKI